MGKFGGLKKSHLYNEPSLFLPEMTEEEERGQ